MATQVTRWLASDDTHHDTEEEADKHDAELAVWKNLSDVLDAFYWYDTPQNQVIEALMENFNITPKEK